MGSVNLNGVNIQKKNFYCDFNRVCSLEFLLRNQFLNIVNI